MHIIIEKRTFMLGIFDFLAECLRSINALKNLMKKHVKVVLMTLVSKLNYNDLAVCCRLPLNNLPTLKRVINAKIYERWDFLKKYF